jgi:hypothetical protein
MALKRLVPLLVLIPVGILVLGYLFRPPPEVIEERSPVQEAILIYSDLTQPLGDTMRNFENAWQKAHREKDGVQLKDELAQKAIPALKLLTESLRSSSPKEAELNAIHQPLLSAYETVLENLQKTCKTEDIQQFNNGHKAVIEDIQALLLAHEKYEEDIRGFYETHNVFPPEAKDPEETQKASENDGTGNSEAEKRPIPQGGTP